MKHELTLAMRAAAACVLCASAGSQVTTRASVSSTGAQGNAASNFPSITADGRYVAFESFASNLVPGDGNGVTDVFVHDRLTGATERVSVDSGGVEGNGGSYRPWISATGRHVAFESLASNLVPGDTVAWDIFVHDRQSGVTERVSIGPSGEEADSFSHSPSISSDGRHVAFYSAAQNLVIGDVNPGWDVFVRDRQAGVTELVSVDSSGGPANASCGEFPAISGDGLHVVFDSPATNLVPGDTNGASDIFVHDRETGVTERVSVDSSGAQGNMLSFDISSISSDGRYVAFVSFATNLVAGDTNFGNDVFVHDRATGATERASISSSGSEGEGESMFPALSADGRHVAFYSWAGNLVPGDTNDLQDVFVHDRLSGATERVSVDSAGAQGNEYGEYYWAPAITADGSQVTFASGFTNLVPDDTNGTFDVFARDRFCSPPPSVYCTAKVNSSGCTPRIAASGMPSASAGSGFFVLAEQVLDQQSGLLFYGVQGPNALAFQGGFLCVKMPLKRTPLQTSSSAGSPPCTGIHSFDFNARIAVGIDPALVVGQQVWSQYWARDGGMPSGTGLTSGLTFVICP